jgi:hypothetical protein
MDMKRMDRKRPDWTGIDWNEQEWTGMDASYVGSTGRASFTVASVNKKYLKSESHKIWKRAIEQLLQIKTSKKRP